MKKYLVIGNPIKHSLSPKLHNHWFKENNIDAAYEKKQLKETDIEGIITTMKNGDIEGMNVTVPFKKSVIPFLDELEYFAKKTQSVNTIYKKQDKIVGDNTDVKGFQYALQHIKYSVKGKKIFILGAGGVTSSIIFALEQMEASKIMLSNRTKQKAESLKKLFPNLLVIDWGEIPDFHMIINATSVGLNKKDEIKLNNENLGKNKFYYDTIYNPRETNFLKKAKMSGNKTENGKMMFIYQAHQAFTIWHKVMPDINDETIKLLE